MTQVSSTVVPFSNKSVRTLKNGENTVYFVREKYILEDRRILKKITTCENWTKDMQSFDYTICTSIYVLYIRDSRFFIFDL